MHVWKIFKIALAYLKAFWVGLTPSAQITSACHMIYSLMFCNSVVKQLFMCSLKFSFSAHNLFLNIKPHVPINTFGTFPQCCLSHTGEICSLMGVGYSSRYDLLGRLLNLSRFCFSHVKICRECYSSEIWRLERWHTFSVIYCNTWQMVDVQ